MDACTIHVLAPKSLKTPSPAIHASCLEQSVAPFRHESQNWFADSETSNYLILASRDQEWPGVFASRQPGFHARVRVRCPIRSRIASADKPNLPAQFFDTRPRRPLRFRLTNAYQIQPRALWLMRFVRTPDDPDSNTAGCRKFSRADRFGENQNRSTQVLLSRRWRWSFRPEMRGTEAVR